jgi:ketosteroid isomerase-like protein
MDRLEKLLKDLPPDLHQEVEDFVQFLLAKRAKTRGRKLREKLTGSLSAKPSHWKNPWVWGLLVGAGLIIALLPWLFISGSPSPPVPATPAPKVAGEKPTLSAPAPAAPVAGPSPGVGAAPPTAETQLTNVVLKNQLSEVLNQLREAQLKKDITLYSQAYAADFPDFDQRRQKTLAVWGAYDYSSLDFDLQEAKLLDADHALAQVTWNIKAEEKKNEKIKTEKQAYKVWFSKDSGQWRIGKLEKETNPDQEGKGR